MLTGNVYFYVLPYYRQQHDSAKHYIFMSIYISVKKVKVVLRSIQYVLLGIEIAK